MSIAKNLLTREAFLPGREGHVGGTAADNRLFVDAVLYRYRAGIPWRDLPERKCQFTERRRRARII
jgi:transposase